MKKNFYVLATFLFLIASAFVIFQATEWKISDNFSIKFDGGDPAGEFKGLKGTISFDPINLKDSKFAVSIEVASINTGNGMKNTHAKSEKWLDAEKYPAIKFTSNEITKTPSGFQAKGILEMHGIQKEITFPFTFENNIFTGGFDINRMDYKINIEEPQHGATILKVNIRVPVSK